MTGPLSPATERPAWWRRAGMQAARLAEAHADFWCRPVPARPAAVARILVGLIVLWEAGPGLGSELHRFLGPEGFVSPESAASYAQWRDQFAPSVGYALPMGAERLLPEAWATGLREGCSALVEGPAGPAVLRIVLAAAGIGLVTGAGARFWACVAWVVLAGLHARIHPAHNGGDRLLRIGLFHLMLMQCAASLTWRPWQGLVARLRGGQGPIGSTNGYPGAPSEPLIPAWPVRLMQLQLGAMYLFTFLSKIPVMGGDWAANDWVNGTALYYALGDVCIPRFGLADLPGWMWRAIAWGALAVEALWVPAVMWRRTRPWALAAGVGLHVGIWVTMEVGVFSPAVLAWYPLFAGRADGERRGPAVETGGPSAAVQGGGDAANALPATVREREER